MGFFKKLERTTQDSAHFIDIAEKYNATTLEGHSQEKRKTKLTQLDWDINLGNSTTRLTRLDWDINTGNSSTQRGGTLQTTMESLNQLDWVINTVETTPQGDTDRKEAKPSRPTTYLHL